MNGSKKQLLKINPALFWDAKINAIDAKIHGDYIIERVVKRGNIKDWQIITKMYGFEWIKKTITKIRFLDKKELSFLSTYFMIPKEEFRCYKPI